MRAKKFRLLDAVLAAVCVILVVEAAAPSAAIGNSQYFWWVLLLVIFFMPYGMITAELGTTYSGKGGIFNWVNRAYGRKWGSRTAWFYWLHFAFWMASSSVLFTELLYQAFGIDLPVVATVLVHLTFIWTTSLLSLLSISENRILINICTVFKVLLMGGLGILGIYFGLTRGFANPVTSARDLLPGFVGIAFIPIILFNFAGFEVVTTFSGAMENPKRQIPQALLLGGILMSAFYILAAFGISVAIPVEELTTYGGLLESYSLFFHDMGVRLDILLPIVAIMFLYTLFVNIVSWALGVNSVTSAAARDGAMPALFGKKNKSGAPWGSVLINGVVASVLVVVAPLIPNPDIFWGFFALQIMALLFAYIPMFPAFRKLREIDPNAERPYRTPGGPVLIALMAYVPTVLLVLAAFFCMVYINAYGNWALDSMLLIGSICAIVTGEIVAYMMCKNKSPRARESKNVSLRT